MEYEQLLNQAYEKIPKKTTTTERWEAPSFSSHQQGNQTIITNINEVTAKIRRKPQHLLKYISKELATAGNYDGKRITLQGRFSPQQLNSRLDHYIKEYVICNECSKPDTDIINFEGAPYKRCQVCGAKAPVKQ